MEGLAVLLDFEVLGTLSLLVEVVDLDPDRDCRFFSASDSFNIDSTEADEVAAVTVSSIAIEDEVVGFSGGAGDVEGVEEILNKSMTIFRLCRFS